MANASAKPRIAVFSGPTATIQNSEPLVTSNKARDKYGLPLRTNPDGSPTRFDVLRLQRLAAPVTVYLEQFSAHPLERDAAELYAPPDGYLDASGAFHKERTSPDDKPVYQVTLTPEDGLYPLPYMARQADGQAWEMDGTEKNAPAELCRVPFFPDGSRLFEEIDRLGISDEGVGCLLSAKADFDFYRALPSGGYAKGRSAGERTDIGDGDIPPEIRGTDFFPYRPGYLRKEPPMAALARLTNVVQRALSSGIYLGAIWLEGSPFVEETTYWLNLLIDATTPICGNSSQRPHGAIGNDGDRNIVDSVDYITSRIWADENGKDFVGAVAILDEQIFTSRDVQKADARPGGYVATGGHGGIIGRMGHPGAPQFSFKTVKRHTHNSQVNLAQLPREVQGSRVQGSTIQTISVAVKDSDGDLRPTAISTVMIAKHARYLPEDTSGDASSEVDILARVEKNLRAAPLAGFVAEGSAPFGAMSNAVDAALQRATFSGMPVVKVGRGNAGGYVDPTRDPLAIAGSNLTATKARLLLMACLMKFGCLPPAVDPAKPTAAETEATKAKLKQYQEIFDTH
ncbi:MAG: asparaginase domain-containing protein [Deltaproteobacteria bacterium]|nr:asparaginase domain-containing protein [Deltaproteobacteria bacterium]MDZ4346981.1 asparaginase domain-containing protein [Candidatus Binatia bacterium]